MASGTLDTPTGARAAIPQRTLRKDRWWQSPLLTMAGLLAWIAYGLVRVFMQKWYWVDDYHYLTPFYSPCVSTGCEPAAAHFGRFLPDWRIMPYAALSLPVLGLFRLTCYYYRKAYYRSFWGSPPACAVPDLHRRYRGETRFPLILQNSHRYFFYAAVVLSADQHLRRGARLPLPRRGFGFGLGNVLLVGNVVLLWAYTVSCHSCRHIIGGRLSTSPGTRCATGPGAWSRALNGKHMQLAWITLGTLALTDVYIMAVAAGWISDLRFVG